MISTEQLVAALEKLAPHDRELLELSLRRRVPDEALATLFEVEEAEIARRRANAIEQLSQLLDLQRGEDLGNVLKSLLEQGTWAEVGARPGAAKAEEGGSEPAAPEEPQPVLELLADRPKAADPEPPRAGAAGSAPPRWRPLWSSCSAARSPPWPCPRASPRARTRAIPSSAPSSPTSRARGARARASRSPPAPRPRPRATS